jgi:hypothetical protein
MSNSLIHKGNVVVTMLTMAFVWLFLSTTSVSAQSTIFSENFQSYAPGSNLIGQGGWIEGLLPSYQTGASVLTISNGKYLPTKVLDGRAATGLFQENLGMHPVVIDTSAITTLQFQLYGTNNTPKTQNGGIGFETFVPGNTHITHVNWYSANNTGPSRWAFDVDGSVFYVQGGYDQTVTLGIVLNGGTNETYGLYDFGSGFIETPHFPVTQAELADINSVSLYVDNRTPDIYTGMEVDNLLLTSVSAVPEPSAILLTTFPAIGFGFYLWRRKRQEARLAKDWV